MAKKEATVQEVLAASDEILRNAGGKMTVVDFRAALEAKVGKHDNAFLHLVKGKRMNFWLEGFNADLSPKLWVINDASLRTAAQPPTEAK